jgi:predicted AAA+ superfamily ATPase
LQIKKIPVPALPGVPSLTQLFEWSDAERGQVGAEARPLVGHFHEYLLRGGFPQTAQVESLSQAQRLLREDIVDKVLKRDMTALFGVRRVLELEQLFVYLCMHDGGLLDVADLCKNLAVKKATANNFLSLLEATHLIHRLPPYGYGKQILRARYKVYLADAAIAPSVMLKGKSLLEDPKALGAAVETAFFKHVYTRFYRQSIGFCYWRGGKKDLEVDLIADVEGRLVPFEVKYRSQATGAGDLKGLAAFCAEQNVDRGYVVTKELADFSVMMLDEPGATSILKIPAALACYWLGRSEVETKETS